MVLHSWVFLNHSLSKFLEFTRNLQLAVVHLQASLYRHYDHLLIAQVFHNLLHFVITHVIWEIPNWPLTDLDWVLIGFEKVKDNFLIFQPIPEPVNQDVFFYWAYNNQGIIFVLWLWSICIFFKFFLVPFLRLHRVLKSFVVGSDGIGRWTKLIMAGLHIFVYFFIIL